MLAEDQAGEKLRCVDCQKPFVVPDTGPLPFEAILAASGAPKKHHRAILLVAAIALLLAATAALLLAIVVPAVRRARHDAWAQARYRTVTHLATALTAYAAANGDEFPHDPAGPLHSLALLYPDYVKSAEGFAFPALSESDPKPKSFPPGCALAGKPCTYTYGHVGVGDLLRPDAAVLEEALPTGMKGGRYAVLADGSVATASPAD